MLSTILILAINGTIALTVLFIAIRMTQAADRHKKATGDTVAQWAFKLNIMRQIVAVAVLSFLAAVFNILVSFF